MMKSMVWRVAPALIATILTLGSALPAGAEDSDAPDTDHLFAFAMGTDVADPGSKELETGFAGRFGRGGGAYTAIDSELSFQYVVARDLRLEFDASGSYHHVANVSGMDDRNAMAFGGLSIAAIYRLLDRSTHGVGLAVAATPYWTRVDDDTGAPVNGFGSAFVIAGDVDLVPDRWVGVVNVSFEPEGSRSRLDDTWSRQNTVGLSGGLMAKVRDNVFAGLEARYLRRYDSLDLGAFAGQAFYLGPTVSINLSERAWVTFGWSTQIAGRANGEDGALDLTNFDRQQARLALGVSF